MQKKSRKNNYSYFSLGKKTHSIKKIFEIAKTQQGKMKRAELIKVSENKMP